MCYTLSLCARSLVSIAQDTNKMCIPMPRILAAYMVGQSKLSMCSEVVGFNTAWSDSLKTQPKRVEKLIFYSMACEQDIAILFS